MGKSAAARLLVLIFSAALCNAESSNSELGGDDQELGSHQPRADDSNCGGVLEAFDEVSTLAYKFQRPLDRYESCIWTIQAPNRAFIKISNIRAYSTYEASSNPFISVGFFNNSDYDHLDSLIWTRMSNLLELEDKIVEIPGPVVFIHFVSTYSYPRLGFSLTYEAVGGPNSSGYNYDNYFLTGEYGTFQYPLHGGNYSNYQRTTIVVKAVPSSNSLGTFLQIRLKRIESNTGCTLDSLNVYDFGSEGDTWYKKHTLCGNTPAGVLFNHPRNDPIILTFKTDSSQVYKGFELFWMNGSF